MTLNLPGYGAVYYYDLLIRYSGSAPTAISASIGSTNTPLTITQVSTGLIRAYASSNGGSGDKITLSFTNTNASYIELKSFRISTLKADHFDISSNCQIISPSYNDTIVYRSSDDINHRYIDATEFDPISCQFTLALTANDWQKYDYIDFELYLTVGSLTSLSASHGNIIIKSIANETENSSSVINDYRVYCTLDLTGLDKTANILPSIIITGNYAVGWVNFVSVVGTSGFVSIAPRNPYTTVLINIWSGITNGFSNLQLWLQDQTMNITLGLQTLGMNIGNHIKTQTDSLIDVLFVWKNQIIEAIKGDPSPGDNFQDEVKDDIDDLNQGSDIIASVTRPDLDDMDIPNISNVGSNGVMLIGNVLTTVMDNSSQGTAFVVAILVSIVAYVLYGKR